MKTTLRCVVCCLGLLAASVERNAVAQGTINFSTRVGASVNAPVTYIGDNTLADDRFLGQLYAGVVGERLAPVGVPSPFRSDAGRGYITAGGVVEVPGISPGSTAQVRMVAWAAWLGGTYAEAVAQGLGDVGESNTIELDLGGGIIPPATLLGLSPFNIATLIPEPSSFAIVVIGCVALLVHRHSMR